MVSLILVKDSEVSSVDLTIVTPLLCFQMLYFSFFLCIRVLYNKNTHQKSDKSAAFFYPVLSTLSLRPDLYNTKVK